MTERERHEYTASLRVFSESLVLADLVAALGEPTSSHDIGEPVGKRVPRPHATAVWSLKSQSPRTQPLDEHVEELVTFAEAHRDGFEALAGKVDVDIFCGVFSCDRLQGGFTFTAGLVRRLGALGLDVTFDHY